MGIAAGINAATGHTNARTSERILVEQQRQNQIEANNANIVELVKQTAAVNKAFTDIKFNESSNPEQRAKADADFQRTRGAIFQQSQKFVNTAIKTGFMTPQEGQIALQSIDIAGKPANPGDAQSIEAQGKRTETRATEGAKQEFNDFVRMENDKGQAIAVRKGDTPPKGFVPVPKTASKQDITTTEITDPNDLRMNDPISSRAALKDLDRVNRQLRKAQDAFDSWRTAKGSGGLTGAIGENIGGLVGQIPLMGEGLENGLNLIITGGTTEENTRARTNAITLASDMLSEITGEESGRFTEAERELAFRALRQLSPSASVSQIAEAYRTFIETSVNEKSRAQAKMKLPSRFNTDDDGKLTVEGQTDYVIHLMKRGFTEPQAIQALKRRIRNEVLEGAS